MIHCDTLIAPRWCVPVRPSGSVLTGHAIALTEGRIIDVLPRSEAVERYQPGQLMERPDHVLIPGLVNAHTHAAMTLFRGLADDLSLEDFLNTRIWPVEKRWVSAEMVRDGTELAIAEMLRGGVTCFSDQYYFPEIVAETATDLQIRAHVGTPVIEFRTAWARDTDEYLNKATDLVHDAYVDHPLITTCFAPHSTAALSDEGFSALRVLADQLDIRVQIHLHETASEITRSVRATGKRPIERLADLGLLNASLLAVHAVHLGDQEIEDLAAAGVSIAHCPRSNLKLASGIARVADYREAGIHVGIGTDGAASNNTLDMLGEQRAAALLANIRSGDAGALGAFDALEMATLESAHCLGLGDEIGSIERGKWADLTCVDLARLHSQPVYDPVSQLVYAARPEQVTDVWVAGRHLLESARLTQIDPGGILARCEEWRERISMTDGH